MEEKWMGRQRGGEGRDWKLQPGCKIKKNIINRLKKKAL